MSVRQEHSPDETTEAYPEKPTNLKRGNFILMNERPCKIVDFQITRTGKHGHSKIFITATDIFNSFKLTECFGAGTVQSVSVPKVTIEEYELIDIDDDDYLELLGKNGDFFEEEIQLYGDELQELSDMFVNSLIVDSTVYVRIVSSMGMHKVPMLVNFYSEYDVACQSLTSILSTIANEKNGKFKLMSLNTDVYPEIAKQFNVQQIPTVFALANFSGKLQALSKFSGLQKEDDIKNFVDDIIKGYNEYLQEQGEPVIDGEQQNIVEIGQKLFAEGKFEEASEIYQQVINDEKESKENQAMAYAGLAMCMVSKNEVESAIQFTDLLKEKFQNEIKENPEIKVIVSMTEIYQLVGKVSEIQEIQKNLQTNPKDLNAKFELAAYIFINEPGLDKKEIAVHEALEILKVDPKWNEGKARNLLVKMFEVLGDCDITKKGRSKMASYLFK
eukprot:gene7376-11698_t